MQCGGITPPTSYPPTPHPTPHPELSGEHTQSLKPRECRWEPSFPRLAGQVFAPRTQSAAAKELGVGFAPGAAPAWPRAPRPPGDCTEIWVRERASVAYGELFCNLPESTGKCDPCKDMPSRGYLNSPAKEQVLPRYSNYARLPTDSSKLNGCKLDTVPSHHSHSSSLAGSPGPGGSGSHATPASPAPSWQVPRAQPRAPRQPVPGRAGLRARFSRKANQRLGAPYSLVSSS